MVSDNVCPSIVHCMPVKCIYACQLSIHSVSVPAAADDDNWDLLLDSIPVLPCGPFSPEYLSSWARLGPNYGVPSQLMDVFKE